MEVRSWDFECSIGEIVEGVGFYPMANGWRIAYDDSSVKAKTDAKYIYV